jgi:hypothetical protein
MPLLVKPTNTHCWLEVNIINGPPESPWQVSIKEWTMDKIEEDWKKLQE